MPGVAYLQESRLACRQPCQGLKGKNVTGSGISTVDEKRKNLQLDGNTRMGEVGEDGGRFSEISKQ